MANKEACAKVLADILAEQAKEKETKSGFDMGAFLDEDYADFAGSSATLKAGVSPNACGTTMCVAGFATLHAGWILEFFKDDNGDVWSEWITPAGHTACDGPNWVEVGRRHLGLTSDEADILFYTTGDDGTTAIEILTRLANGEKITRTDWFEYAKEAGSSVARQAALHMMGED